MWQIRAMLIDADTNSVDGNDDVLQDVPTTTLMLLATADPHQKKKQLESKVKRKATVTVMVATRKEPGSLVKKVVCQGCSHLTSQVSIHSTMDSYSLHLVSLLASLASLASLQLTLASRTWCRPSRLSTLPSVKLRGSRKRHFLTLKKCSYMSWIWVLPFSTSVCIGFYSFFEENTELNAITC